MLLTFEEIALPLDLSGLVLLLVVLRRRKRSWLYCFAFALLWLYLLSLVGLALFPIPIPDTMENRQTISHIISQVNLIPFDFGGLFNLHPNVIWHELGGNILLTVPFGLGIPFLFRIRVRSISWLAVKVGLAIETAQLLVSIAIRSAYRGVDINDVLLNAVGVLIGFGIFRASTWLITALRLLHN